MIAQLAVSAIAFVVTFLLVALMLSRRWHWAVDHPNDRSLHDNPTPRSGGIAVMTGTVVAAACAGVWLTDLPVQALGLAVLLAAISLADDRRGLPITARLLTHALAAGLFAAWLTNQGAPWWWMAGSILAITAMTNFYNFMDGANGLAGGMAVTGFGCYGIASVTVAPGFAALCFALAAAAAGFLRFNLVGRIFLGDGGSVPMGFLAAALGLQGWHQGMWPIWFAPLLFAPFLMDSTVTLLRRLLRRERFWQAHREHYYQRLVRSGWSHLQLAGLEYSLMLICAAGALVARNGTPLVQIATFATIAALLITCGLYIDFRWKRHQAASAALP